MKFHQLSPEDMLPLSYWAYELKLKLTTELLVAEECRIDVYILIIRPVVSPMYITCIASTIYSQYCY